MKDELGRKIMTKFVGLRAKTYSYLIDDGNKRQKTKRNKNMCHKEKNRLEAAQLENEINYLQKYEINIDSFFCYKGEHKEFIKNNKIILKIQQRFKSERHNVFTEEIKKIALISNGDNKNGIN